MRTPWRRRCACELARRAQDLRLGSPRKAVAGAAEDPTRAGSWTRWTARPTPARVAALGHIDRARAQGPDRGGRDHDPAKARCSGPRRGRGAWLNNTRLRVSGRSRMIECVFATGLPFGRPGRPSREPAGPRAPPAGLRGRAALGRVRRWISPTSPPGVRRFLGTAPASVDLAAGLVICRGRRVVEPSTCATSGKRRRDCRERRDLRQFRRRHPG